MILPAAILVAAGLFLGLIPGLMPSARSAAAQFVSSRAYAAHVLSDAPMPAADPGPPAPAGRPSGLIAPAGALAIAAGFLF